MRRLLKDFFGQIISTLRMQDTDESLHGLYRLNLLKIIIYGNLAGVLAIVIFTITTTNHPRIVFTGLVFGILVTICTVLALRIIKQGNVRLVSRIIIFGGFVVLALLAYGSNGVYSSVMMAFVGLLVTGTLLLDLNARITLYVLLIASFFVLLQIEMTENLPEAPFKDLPFRVFLLTCVFTSIFLILNYHLFAIRKTEDRIRSLEVNDERHKVQRQLTQDLAHDLRTPLTSLRTTTYLIGKRASLGLPTDNLIEQLEYQSDRLNNMIEELFQLTLLDDLDKRDTFEIIDVMAVLHRAIADAQPYAEEHKINVVVEHAPKSRVLGHRLQLKRVFDNLIENAIHYGCDGGYIHITMTRDDEYHHIQFEDNGIGIPPEHHRKIFDRFYRVDNARSARKNQGTGIGLNAAYQIVQLHGGHITVDSATGGGSTFTVSLPKVRYEPVITV